MPTTPAPHRAPRPLRRWTLRHPLAWVLGLALVLLGAQTAHQHHALSHGLPVATDADGHAAPLAHAGDCASCLAGAALAGAAPAPSFALAIPVAEPPAFVAVAETTWPGRFLRAYAPRGPPHRA